MNRPTLIFVCGTLVWAVYHTVRDILQIAWVHGFFTEVLHWPHQWCAAYCDYMLFPVELFVFAASIVVIKRKKFGALGLGIILALLIGVLMVVLK